MNAKEEIIELLTKKADQEKEDNIFWLEIEDKDDELINYCYDCGEKEYEKLKKKYKKKEVRFCEGVSYEDNRFNFCERCGKRLHTALVLDKQELEYWEEIIDEIKYFYDLSIHESFELKYIFEECYFQSEYKERLDILIGKLLKLKEVKE